MRGAARESDSELRPNHSSMYNIAAIIAQLPCSATIRRTLKRGPAILQKIDVAVEHEPVSATGVNGSSL